jgi:ion channel
VAAVKPRESDEQDRYLAAVKQREVRCSYLFFALLTLLIASPFTGDTSSGRTLIGVLNVAILATAVAAVARSKLWLVTALLLGLPAVAFQVMAIQSGLFGYFALCWAFAGLFYAFTLAHVLVYVLHRDVMTADKLYGAVAAYVMIGIMWAFAFGVLQYFYPDAYVYQGTTKHLDFHELLFFSFAVLTTAGFGDITPIANQARMLTILEAITGVMYVAILIARLTGVYPVVPQAKPQPPVEDLRDHRARRKARDSARDQQ